MYLFTLTLYYLIFIFHTSITYMYYNLNTIIFYHNNNDFDNFGDDLESLSDDDFNVNNNNNNVDDDDG